jgi:cation diffusion facilitator CzcD-associated flavoprotein CzcO
VNAVVVGAGPAGLATAASVRRRGVEAVLLERGARPAEPWRGRSDRLRLHTIRWLSGLPGHRIPRSAGRWVSRDAFVEYLERQGTLVRSSACRAAAPHRGRDVLVVGSGSSAAELAVDLVEGGAGRVRIAVRTPPNIVRRDTLGFPVARLDGAAVVPDGGRRVEPDAVVAATGFRPGLEPLVGNLGVLDDRGFPVRTHPGLHFAAITVELGGLLREADRRARRDGAYGRRRLPRPGGNGKRTGVTTSSDMKAKGGRLTR